MSFTIGINHRDEIVVECSKALELAEAKAFHQRLTQCIALLKGFGPQPYTTPEWTPTATKTAPEPVTVQNEPAPTPDPEAKPEAKQKRRKSFPREQINAIRAEFAQAIIDHGGKAHAIRALHAQGKPIDWLSTGAMWSADTIRTTVSRDPKTSRLQMHNARQSTLIKKAPQVAAEAPPAAKEAEQVNLPFVSAPAQHRPLHIIEAELRAEMERKDFKMPQTPEAFERDARRLAVKGYFEVGRLSRELVAALDHLRPSTPSSPAGTPLDLEVMEKRNALIREHGNRRRAVIHQVRVEKLPRAEVIRFWEISSSTVSEYLDEPSTGLSSVSKSLGTTAGDGRVDPAKLFGGTAREARK